MEVLVMRNCVVDDRYYPMGTVAEVPDDWVEKYEKNFQPYRSDSVEIEQEVKKVKKQPPKNIPPSKFWCEKCQKTHFIKKKKTGRNHPHFNKS